MQKLFFADRGFLFATIKSPDTIQTSTTIHEKENIGKKLFKQNWKIRFKHFLLTHLTVWVSKEWNAPSV